VNPSSSFGRGLAGRVSEVGTPQPRPNIDPARKAKSILADVGQGLLAVAPLAVAAIPGLGPAAGMALKAGLSLGGGLAAKARGDAASRRAHAFEATQASAQQGGETIEPRGRYG
tara:strand:- start:200 stop:541 length:342 start_codon:yes stop_codon:yes gene_type:complete